MCVCVSVLICFYVCMSFLACMCMRMHTSSLFREFTCQQAEFYNAGSHMNEYMCVFVCERESECVCTYAWCVVKHIFVGVVHPDSRLHKFMCLSESICTLQLWCVCVCVCVAYICGGYASRFMSA